MTQDQFEVALRAFCRRRPFRGFLIEFISGNQMSIHHPEAIRPEGALYVARNPDGGYVLFPVESVARLLDGPIAKT